MSFIKPDVMLDKISSLEKKSSVSAPAARCIKLCVGAGLKKKVFA